MSTAKAEAVKRIRDVLCAGNYSESGIIQFLGGKVPLAPIAVEIPAMVLRTNGGSPTETLIRLFLLKLRTDVDATRRALQPMALEDWVDAGLVELQDDVVVPLVRIVPYQKLWLASDICGESSQHPESNFVMGLGGSSLALASSTIRRPSRLTLDVGTGTGIQSFLTSAHSEGVYGVDCNPRAIRFATFNARLNGLANIEFREGNLCEPVVGKQFDLIVSNPPFVISPEFRAYYRDGGMQGDQFCQQLLSDIPERLTEGGFCQIMCNWAHIRGQNWEDRLAQWFEGNGCDVWVIRKETREPSDYAMFWNRREAAGPAFAKRYDSWMQYYKSERIDAISTGLVTMRRTSGRSNWYRTEDVAPRSCGSVGNDILRGFGANDFLERVDDRDLLNTRLIPGPDVRWKQQMRPTSQGWKIVDGQLHRTTGLGYVGKIDPDTVELVVKCDGQRRVGALLNDLAHRRNVRVDSIVPAYLVVLRRLITRGFLLPASSDERENRPQHNSVEPQPDENALMCSPV